MKRYFIFMLILFIPFSSKAGDITESMTGPIDVVANVKQVKHLAWHWRHAHSNDAGQFKDQHATYRIMPFYLEIDWFNNTPPPWSLTIHLKKKYKHPIRVWCANFGPEGFTDIPPADVGNWFYLPAGSADGRVLITYREDGFSSALARTFYVYFAEPANVDASFENFLKEQIEIGYHTSE